jgi:tetrapyrrole methylase family protein/MazG family protein
MALSPLAQGLWSPVFSMKSSTRHINRLLAIMARLRGPGGCPWDQEQSHQSIRHHLIEECYEAVEALDDYVRAMQRRTRSKSGSSKKRSPMPLPIQEIEAFKQELGDLLLQIVFHSQMASEVGAFDFDDVVVTLCKKLVRRHPHIFGKTKVGSSDEVLQQWEQIKKQEKNATSIVGDVPRHLPSLLKADKIQRKVARVGFDWKHTRDVVAKVEEELRELKGALASGDRKQFEEELGDLLFAAVNLARYERLQAEELLDRCITKFTKRFQEVERAVHRDGRRLEDCSLEELDALWEAAKHKQKRPKPARRQQHRSSPSRR